MDKEAIEKIAERICTLNPMVINWDSLADIAKESWRTDIGSLVDECDYPLCKVRQSLGNS
jgi:hypothetical protein